ncbi:MAG: hypothetical protein ACP5H2_07855 [Solirubrobacteraceae bacterium]
MSSTQLLLFLVVVHVLGVLAVGVLIIPALRNGGTDPDDGGEGSDEGWGNTPNVRPSPSRWPGGGIPLPDAVQSSVRLRGPQKLADNFKLRRRGPAREPIRIPVRTHQR